MVVITELETSQRKRQNKRDVSGRPIEVLSSRKGAMGTSSLTPEELKTVTKSDTLYLILTGNGAVETYRVFRLITSVGFSKRSYPVKNEVLSCETEVLSGGALRVF